MPATNRLRTKGRREGGTFAAFPHSIFRSTPSHPAPAARLSRAAMSLLIDMAMKYDGRNNGNLSASPKVMEPARWQSKGTLEKALVECIAKGFIEVTRQGGRNRASLFALTWHGIDRGPHDAAPNPVASQLYKPEHIDRRDQRYIRRWEALRSGRQIEKPSRYLGQVSRYSDQSGGKDAA